MRSLNKGIYLPYITIYSKQQERITLSSQMMATTTFWRKFFGRREVLQRPQPEVPMSLSSQTMTIATQLKKSRRGKKLEEVPQESIVVRTSQSQFLRSHRQAIRGTFANGSLYCVDARRRKVRTLLTVALFNQCSYS